MMTLLLLLLLMMMMLPMLLMLLLMLLLLLQKMTIENATLRSALDMPPSQVASGQQLQHAAPSATSFAQHVALQEHAQQLQV